jgi:CRISPR-associated protein Cmr1
MFLKKVSIQLELLTDMFSFGNDHNPEFRVTELKSLLSQTLKELYFFENLSDMKKIESEYFGNTEKKSPVSIKIKKINDLNIACKKLLTHKTNSFKQKCLTVLNEKRTTICLELYSYFDDALKIFIFLLIQSSIIGGLGKRCRRGSGSFRITSIFSENSDVKNTFNFLDELKLPHEIIEKCSDEIKTINKKITDKITFSKDSKENFILSNKNKLPYPYIKKITFKKLNIGYNEAIKQIDKETHNRNQTKVLGSAKPRFASPIYITFWENTSKEIYLVIKELNYDYFLKSIDNFKESFVDDFINEIKKI